MQLIVSSRTLRYILMAACLMPLWLALSMASQEIRTSKARNALAIAAKSTGENRLEFLNKAKKALTPPGPTGELYDLTAQLALLSPQTDLNAAQMLTQLALQRSPVRAESWARLAYIERVREGKLTDKALNYLDRSFVVEPAGYTQFILWRMEFMFAHWSQLSLSLQEVTMRSYCVIAIWYGKGYALKMAQKAGNQDLEMHAEKTLDLTCSL